MDYKELKQFILEYVKENDSFPAGFDTTILSRELAIEIVLTNSNYLDVFGVDKFTKEELKVFIINNPRAILPKIPEEIINGAFLAYLIKKDPNVIEYVPSSIINRMNPWEINNIDFSKLKEQGYIRLINYIYENNYNSRNMREYLTVNDEFYKHMDSKVKNFYLKRVIIPNKTVKNHIVFKNIEEAAIDEYLVRIGAKHLKEATFIDLFGEKIFKSKYAKVIKEVNAPLYLNNVSKEEATEEMYKELFEKDYYNILEMPLSQTNKKMWITTLYYSLGHKLSNFRRILSRMPARYYDKKTLDMLLNKYTSFVKYVSPKAFNADMILNFLKKIKETEEESKGENWSQSFSVRILVKNVENLIIAHMNKEIFDFCYENNLFTSNIVGEANIGNFIIDHPVVFEKLVEINPTIIKKAKKAELNDPEKYKQYIIDFDPEIIKYVPERMLSSEFIYECALKRSYVVNYVMETPRLRKYVTLEFVRLYILKGSEVRLDYIPEELLSLDIALEIFRRDPDALLKVPVEKRTRRMYEIAADLGITSKGMPSDLEEMVRYNREIDKEQDKLEQKKLDYEAFGKYIPMYFSDNAIGLKTFCEEKGISESKFRKVLTDLKDFYPEIYKEYRLLTDIHHDEAWGHVLDVFDEVKTALDEGVVNPETKKKTELNVILYYLIASLNPKELSNVLWKRLPKEKSKMFYRQIATCSNTSSRDVKTFYDTNIQIKTENGYKALSSEEKDLMIDFLDRNRIPKNRRTLSVLTKMYLNKEIDLNKTYPKIIKYDLEKEKRKAISERLSVIRIQDEIIKQLDEKINELESSRRRAIL